METFRIIADVPSEKSEHFQPGPGELKLFIQSSSRARPLSDNLSDFSNGLLTHFPYDTDQWIHECHPDIIVSEAFGMRTLRAGMYTVFHRKKKLVVWATVSDVTAPARTIASVLLQRAILKVASGVLVDGSSGCSYFESLGFPRTRIHQVRQATESDRLRGALAQATAVLDADQLIERKRLMQFLNSIR